MNDLTNDCVPREHFDAVITALRETQVQLAHERGLTDWYAKRLHETRNADVCRPGEVDGDGRKY